MKNITKIETISKNLDILKDRLSDIGRVTSHGLNDYGYSIAGELKWRLEDDEYNMTIDDIWLRREKNIIELDELLPILIRDEKINNILKQ